MSETEIDIPCIGVCIVDDAGYCLGCGRPPAGLPEAADEAPGDPSAVAESFEVSEAPVVQRPATASAVSTTLTQ